MLKQSISTVHIKFRFAKAYLVLAFLMGAIACDGINRKGESDSESQGLIARHLKPATACERDMQIDGDLVTICNWDGQSFRKSFETKLATGSELVMRDLLSKIGFEGEANDLYVILIPKELSPMFNMVMSYKWHTQKAKYVNLIQLAPQFESLKDDSSFMLALVHEVGHMRQYAKGESIPADILIRECSKFSESECLKKFPLPSYRVEDHADDFMMDFAKLFPWQDHNFNPYSAVEFFKNFPDSPQYRPSSERARLLKELLIELNISESKDYNRQWITRLEEAVAKDLRE
jgi:hypothetical protein